MFSAALPHEQVLNELKLNIINYDLVLIYNEIQTESNKNTDSLQISPSFLTLLLFNIQKISLKLLSYWHIKKIFVFFYFNIYIFIFYFYEQNQ